MAGIATGLLAGVLFGAVQLWVLSLLVKAVTANDTAKIFAIVMGKLFLWGAFFTLVVLFFRSAILWCGIGAASALVLGGFGGFVLNWRRR